MRSTDEDCLIRFVPSLDPVCIILAKFLLCRDTDPGDGGSLFWDLSLSKQNKNTPRMLFF